MKNDMNENSETLNVNHERLSADAANNSPIGSSGKITLNLKFDDFHKLSHDFYKNNEMAFKIILGLEWLVANKVNVDMAEMILKLPDGSTKPLCLFDSSDSTLAHTLSVVLNENLVCTCGFTTALIWQWHFTTLCRPVTNFFTTSAGKLRHGTT